MLRRGVKEAFYRVAGPVMKVNGLLYRGLRAPRNGDLKVQLGPGQRNYMPGWINVDANKFTGKCDVWADLRNPLPFRTGTVAAMYSHHVIEHLPDLLAHFKDVYRCMRPGGVYRVGGPNGDVAIRKFVDQDEAWFIDYPDARASIGGKFENFIFCRGEHLTILTYSYLEEIMKSVGFVSIRRCAPVKETNYPHLFNDCLAKEWETDDAFPHTLLIEAEKPA